MAGTGKRFDDYLSPKPLIDIEGKPMIEHALSFLPKDNDFIFLCNENHLKTTNMEAILRELVPNLKIIPVPSHTKGPAYTSLLAFEDIKDEEEVIVTYCDTIQIFDFEEFMKKIREIKLSGALLSFKGFHPASLGETYYCYLKVNEQGFIEELKEKESYTNNRLEEFASSGVYYFASGKIFKDYVKQLTSNEQNAVNGEFYMSLPFNIMIKDGLKVLNYPINKFISLGIPRDYEMYKFWSEFFLNYSRKGITFDNININVTNIFPLAGGEKDFKELGFEGLNFMIPVMNKPLIEYALKSNPKGVKNIFIGLQENEHLFKNYSLFNTLNSRVILLEKKKESLIKTLLTIKKEIGADAAICISGATHILNYNEKNMINLMEKNDIDIILFSFSHDEAILRNPLGFAYAKLKNNIEIEEIKEKETISDNPYADNALTGTAIFKKAADLFEAIELELLKPNPSKYYLSSLNNILNKKKTVIFKVDKFVPVRTITNYKEFTYWEDYFDSLKYHPYKKEYN